MNKKELVARIAESTGLTQAQTARALDCTINIIQESLKEGDKKPAKALDSTILLIRPEQKPPKKGRALDSTINLVPDHVIDAGKVAIHGFGTFYTTQRKARVGRNPRTGAEVKIKARIVPKFKFSKTLVDRIN